MGESFETLLAAVLRVIREHGGGDDLAADVMLRFVETLRGLDDEVQDQIAYTRTAATRAAVAHQKRARRRRRHEPKALPPDELQDAADPKLINRESKIPSWQRAIEAVDELNAILDRMPNQDHAKILRLFYFDRMQIQDIADRLKSTVRHVTEALAAWKNRAI